jgi:16S rRNA processing protein RimM
VLVIPISNRSERFAAGSVLDADGRELRIASYQDRWLVHFDGVDTRDAAEALRGTLLTAEPLGDARDGEVWVHEVIGSTVTDRAGNPLGRVVAVEANPAHDLIVTDGGALIPMVFVVEQEPGRVVVDVPEGLLELFG